MIDDECRGKSRDMVHGACMEEALIIFEKKKKIDGGFVIDAVEVR